MSFKGEVFEPIPKSSSKQRAILVQWLNSLLPDISLPANASDEDLRAFLADGTVLCQILSTLKPGSVAEYGGPFETSEWRSENVKRFLSAMENMGLRTFQLSELEKGFMKIVYECLLSLRSHFMAKSGEFQRSDSNSQFGSDGSTRWKLLGDCFGGANGIHRVDSRGHSSSHRSLHSPVMSESSASLIHHAGNKFHEVFQLKNGRYSDLPASKISEMMKSNSLDNAPTQSLLSVVNGILDESVERKSGEIPQRVALLLRKVVQEIERRISTQAEHLKTQNNLFKAREEKYQSRIRVLASLANETTEETQIANKIHHIKNEQSHIEEKMKADDAAARLIKEKDDHNHEIAVLKQELEAARKTHEQWCLQKETEAKEAQQALEEISVLKQELEAARKTNEQSSLQTETEAKDAQQALEEISVLKQELEAARKTHEQSSLQTETEARDDAQQAVEEIAVLKQELEEARKTHEQHCLEMGTESREAQQALEERLKEVTKLSTDWKSRAKELEASSELKSSGWNKKEHLYQIFTELQLGALRELKFASQSIKQEVVITQKGYSEEFNALGVKIKTLQNAAENYYSILAENRKLHNELQELKGNIRVYCRIRPSFSGQKESIVEYVGENGELIVVNPAKQGKESRRLFKFDKVYGQAATQVEVFSDTQPLIQSVLDGFSVCIFAYGQTGSGKTYTMSGPDHASEEELGVNFRALNNLFRVSQSRESTFAYDISAQMVEIYNEQVRDLLTSDGSQKRLGILSTSKPNGLAVPDASVYPVKATSDVLHLMDIGLKNRAKGSTALNERSSRSHSILSIHVRGVDQKTGSSMQSSLHLVDLAGSERVDKSEVTGDRLKEAQHINKSLSALGDVIFALAQKSSHIPYRNSKLTQVLQSSLGGNAKTLMFVQLNPDTNSFSESISTLKFAERVSGVELGAAKSSKDGRDVRELMEQVSSLKDTIAKKDEEIERLQLNTHSLRYGYSERSMKLSGGGEKAASDHEDNSESSDNYSVDSLQQNSDDIRNKKESLQQSRTAGGNIGQNILAKAEIFESSNAGNVARVSDISDYDISLGTETDGSTESGQIVEGSKRPEITNKLRTASAPRSPRAQEKSPRVDFSKGSTGIRKSPSTTSLSPKPARRWQ